MPRHTERERARRTPKAQARPARGAAKRPVHVEPIQYDTVTGKRIYPPGVIPPTATVFTPKQPMRLPPRPTAPVAKRPGVRRGPPTRLTRTRRGR